MEKKVKRIMIAGGILASVGLLTAIYFIILKK